MKFSLQFKAVEFHQNRHVRFLIDWTVAPRLFLLHATCSDPSFGYIISLISLSFWRSHVARKSICSSLTLSFSNAFASCCVSSLYRSKFISFSRIILYHSLVFVLSVEALSFWPWYVPVPVVVWCVQAQAAEHSFLYRPLLWFASVQA